MTEREPFPWPPPGESNAGSESIAVQIAARIEAVPPAPGDAIEWAAAAAGFEREAAALGRRPAAAQLLYEAGRIYEERLGDDAVALEFHRRALFLDRTFLPNLRSCRRIALRLGDDALAAEALQAEVSAVLEPFARSELLLLLGRILARLGKAAESRDVLALADATAPSAFSTAEESIRIAAERGERAALAESYVRAARAAADRRLSAHYLSAASALYEEALGEPERAASLALDAFALLPSDPFLRDVARQHAERLDRTDALAEILRAEAEASSGAASATSFLALAQLEERLGRIDPAIAALERGRVAAPEEPLLLSELVRLRETRGAWADASGALESLARAHLARKAPGHVAEAVSAKLRRAELEDHQLGRPLAAVGCCRDVLELDPGNRNALSMVGRLYARLGDWEGLLFTFEAEAAVARDDRERALRLFKAAEVLEERLARVDEALARHRQALALDPDLLPARAAIERICEAEGRWEDLCALLEGDVEGLQTPTERVAHLFRIARLREERLGDPARAASLYQRILGIDAGNRVATAALEGALARLSRWADLAELLSREASASSDPRRRIALLQRRAEVLDAHVEDLAARRAAWEDLRAAAPGHLPALRALGRLHARAGRWEDLAAMYRAEAAATPDVSAAADLLHRVGEIEERRLERADRAMGAYQEALTLAPGHLPALEALARLYRAHGENERLVENLRAQAAARPSTAERAAALAESARIIEERLGDPARAIEAYEEALGLAPGFAPALRALDRLYAQAGRFEDLTGLRRAAAADPGAPDRAERLLRLARLEADRAGDASAALRAAEEALAERPEHPAALLLVQRLSPDPERRAKARLALAQAADEPDSRAALLAAAALDLRPAAARRDALARAASLAPASAVLAPEEERRLREAGDLPALARFCEARRREASDAASRTCWSVQAGETWERAGEPDRALAAFQEALESAPSHLPALRGARALFAQRGDWAAVRATLHAEAEALVDPHGAASAWLEAGALAERHFGDPEAAAADYRKAAEREPGSGEPLRRLEALLGSRGAPDVAKVHETRARAETDSRRAAEAWLASARASLDVNGGNEAAVAALDRALEAQPELAAALELRSRLHANSGRPREALADCEACLALGGEPASRLPLHLSAAALLEESLGDPARALDHVHSALALAPESPDALTRLARLQSALGRPADSAAALRRLVDVPGLPRERLVELLLSLADADERLGSLEAAVAACRRAIEIDPGHEAAHRTLLRLEAQAEPRARLPALEAAAGGARGTALRAEAHVEAARVHAGASGGQARAIAHLRLALDLDPRRQEARARLAELLEESSPEEAIEQHRLLLGADPLRAPSWFALYRHFERSRTHDRAYVAACVLRWLGVPLPGPAAEQLLREGEGQPLALPAPLRPEDLALLRAPGDGGALAEVVEAAGDAIAAAMGESPEQRGEPLRDDHPLHRALQEIGRALPLPRWQLFAGTIGRVDVEPAVPYRILVGPDVARRTTVRERRFLAGRAAERLRSRSCLSELLPPAALAGWITAAVHCIVPGARGLKADEVLVRQVGKSLSRRARKGLEGPARTLAARGTLPDVAAWQAAAAATADRAGLVLCGDVASSLGTLLGEGSRRAPKGEEAVRAATSRPDVLALLAFVASEEHFTLRQRLRIAIA